MRCKMEKWRDLEKWAEETANIHIVKILRDSGYTDEQIKKELSIDDCLKNLLVK